MTPLATDVSKVSAATIFKLQYFLLDVSGSINMLTSVYKTIRRHVPIVRYILGVAVEMYLNLNGTVGLGC